MLNIVALVELSLRRHRALFLTDVSFTGSLKNKKKCLLLVRGRLLLYLLLQKKIEKKKNK